MPNCYVSPNKYGVVIGIVIAWFIVVGMVYLILWINSLIVKKITTTPDHLTIRAKMRRVILRALVVVSALVACFLFGYLIFNRDPGGCNAFSPLSVKETLHWLAHFVGEFSLLLIVGGIILFITGIVKRMRSKGDLLKRLESKAYFFSSFLFFGVFVAMYLLVGFISKFLNN